MDLNYVRITCMPNKLTECKFQLIEQLVKPKKLNGKMKSRIKICCILNVHTLDGNIHTRLVLSNRVLLKSVSAALTQSQHTQKRTPHTH